MTGVDQLLDNAAAAAMLSISTRTLAKLRDNGEIPAVRVCGGRKGIRFSRAAVEQFISNRPRVGSPATELRVSATDKREARI